MGLVKIVRFLEVSTFQRFGQNFQFLSFFSFALLYEDIWTFSDEKGEEIGYN